MAGTTETVTLQPSNQSGFYNMPPSDSSSPAVIDVQPMVPMVRSNTNALGLEALMQVETLVLKEERDIMERLLGDKCPCGPFGMGCGPPEKRYSGAPTNNSTNKIFWLQENSGCLPRRCWPRMRQLDIVAKDAVSNRDLFRIERNVSCMNCCSGTCFPGGCYGHYGNCCADAFKLQVSTPDHAVLGYVEQRKSCLALEFDIMNQDHQVQYTFKTGFTDGFLTNPCYVFPCVMPPCLRWINSCADVVAPLKNAAGQQVGSISWQYDGIMETCVLATHKFGITFPPDADAAMRATIIGASILFENFFGPWNPVFCCPLMPL